MLPVFKLSLVHWGPRAWRPWGTVLSDPPCCSFNLSEGKVDRSPTDPRMGVLGISGLMRMTRHEMWWEKSEQTGPCGASAGIQDDQH